MAGFKTDAIKASFLAMATVLLLGAAIYALFPLIETAPKAVALLDTYTEKGGYGLGTISSFYLYTENVSIFANLKDTTDKPIVNATVKFEIHGPPGSNLTLSQTANTNSSGVAVATLPAPQVIGQLGTVQGIWSAIVTTEITGTQVADSLAFEVKAPPRPFVDVYTDRGGKGPNNSSQSYNRDENVTLYAKASNGTSPYERGLVVFAVYWPGPANTSALFFLTTPQTNASGIATVTFRIPSIQESIGTWRVFVTVRVDVQVLIDALTFECN